MEAEDLKEATNLALTTLIEVNLEVGGIIRVTNDFLEAQMLPFFDGPLEQARREGRIVITIQDDLVALDDTARGVHDLVGQFSVVGQDEQAFRILVEATDAE